MSRVGTRGIRRPAGAVENVRRLGLIRPRDPSWCPVTLSSEGRPLLAVSGSSWGPARCVVACSLDSVWSLAIAGAQGTWACSRLSPTVPGPRGGTGRTCRAPSWACSVSNATSPSVKCQAGSYSAYPVQQRLRYVRCWLFTSHWGPPCSDDPVSSSGRDPGPWSMAARIRTGTPPG